MRSAPLAFVLVLVAVASAMPQGGFPQRGPPPQGPPQRGPPPQGPQGGAPPQGPPPPPAINWGKCSQLKPTAGDQEKKRGVIEECLKQNPPPAGETLTEEQVEKHRETITTCALKSEGWFNQNGSYKFERAKTEIQNKRLPSDVEPEILKKHDECQKEAVEKFADNFIHQIQLYQSCMDFHISKICDIQVGPPQQ